MDYKRYDLIRDDIFDDRYDAIEEFLQTYDDDIDCIYNNNSLLTWACGFDRLNIVKLLVAYGANINRSYDRDNEALEMAIGHSRRDIVEYLIDKVYYLGCVVANPRYQCVRERGEYLKELTKSLYRELGHDASMKIDFNVDANDPWLVKDCIKPFPWISSNNPIFIRACYQGRFEVISWLIEHIDARDIDVPDRDGDTLLVTACKAGHLNIVKLLVINGANVNYRKNKRNAPLQAALDMNHGDIVQYLIDKVYFIGSIEYDSFILPKCDRLLQERKSYLDVYRKSLRSAMDETKSNQPSI